MKKFLVFTIVIISFFLIPKDVSATLITLDEFKDVINSYNDIETFFGEEVDEAYKIEAEVKENILEITTSVFLEEGTVVDKYIGILEGRYLIFNYDGTHYFNDEVFYLILVDAYGQFHGFEPLEFVFYFFTLLDDLYNNDDLIDDLLVEYEGIKITGNYDDTNDKTVTTLQLDLGVKPKEPENKEVIEDEEIIDVNPPTGLNTHYLSLSILGITTIFSLFKLNKKKYLV